MKIVDEVAIAAPSYACGIDCFIYFDIDWEHKLATYWARDNLQDSGALETKGEKAE